MKKYIIPTLATIALSTLFQTVQADEANSVQNKADFSTDSIYQIVTDRFSDGDATNNAQGELFDKSNPRKYHGGDWKGIISKIQDGYLTKMGISAIWISSPVENIESIDPSSNSAAYHGYWARDFFRTNKHFGTMEDFKELISVAHANNIKIVIDFAPNHTSTAEYSGYTFPEDGALYRDAQLVGKFTGDTQNLFNHESWSQKPDLEDGIYHSLYGLADLNNVNPTVDTYMKDAIQLWLDMGVDGIRVDAVKHMSLGWQKNWLSSIYEKHNVFAFGEWFVGGVGNDRDMAHFTNNSGMSLLDFRFANAVRKLYTNLSASMGDFYNVMKATEADYEEVTDQVTFIDNHDMKRFSTIVNGNKTAVHQAYTLLLTSRGVPNLYYGSEQYAQGADDPENRGDMTSFDQNSVAYQVISKLAPLRKINQGLAYGDTQQRWVNQDVLVFERKFGDHVALIALNKNQSRSYQVTNAQTAMPAGTHADKLGGLLGGSDLVVTQSGSVQDFELAPGKVTVWTYEGKGQELGLADVDTSMGLPGNTVTLSGQGFGTETGTVYFNDKAAEVLEWDQTLVKVRVPELAAGSYSVSLTTSAGSQSNAYANFEVLTNKFLFG
ncbi:alpha-amylase family glycosyl hydrolase [Streptococcus sp. X13SY08]|uniref:alpha-amylase family glycosyl hydrolase n=1 Tax=unclassified Streptococcus TaxID=2608887 RepID=UPI000AE2581E|nr:alpha-amylase family glycosyl hydrolase [Streptococcus sp. X13SY08]